MSLPARHRYPAGDRHPHHVLDLRPPPLAWAAVGRAVLICATEETPSCSRPGIVRSIAWLGGRTPGAGAWSYAVEEPDAALITHISPFGIPWEEPTLTWCAGWQLTRPGT